MLFTCYFADSCFLLSMFKFKLAGALKSESGQQRNSNNKQQDGEGSTKAKQSKPLKLGQKKDPF